MNEDRPAGMPAKLHAEAQRLINAGRFEQAAGCCRRILQREPGHADARFLLGIAGAASGRFDEAATHIGAAIELDAGRAEYHAHLARCLAMLKRDREAVAAADRAMALEPRDALTLDTLGVVYSRAGAHAGAADVFRRAVERHPRDPGYRFNLGTSLQFAGDFEGAGEAFEAALELKPDFLRAHAALSGLRRQTADRNHVPRLEALLAGIDNPEDALLVRHALAKELEDLGDYDRAFAELSAGKARRRAQLDYDFERDAALFDALERACGTPGRSGCEAQEPIFIVGMPRTGTTLVERILSAHSRVESAGELQNFAVALKRAAGTPSREVLDVPTIEQGVDADFTALGGAYLESTRPGTGRTPHFIDKMPLNFLYIGFIQRALPRARVICLRRNPMDTCLSNYRQLFALNFSYYNYALDLLDTGRYYLRFDRLMQHWRRVLPGHVLEVRYEELVDDTEARVREMLAFCGLEWEPACLAFHDNPAPVATASSVQVRRPLYRDAVGRWRRYEKHLAPLLELFGDAKLALD